MDEKSKKRKKKIAAGMIAGVTSASVLLGSTFDSPQDLLDNPDEKTEPVRDQIQETLNEKQPARFGASLRRSIRNIIYKIPVRLRMLLCVPMWYLGNALLFAADLLTATLLTPIARFAFGFLLQTLLLMGVIGICIKVLFPDLPWKKIFNKKTILSAIIGSIIMSICDAVVPLFWDRYRVYRRLSKLILGSVVILLILKPFLKKKWKERISYDIQYDLDHTS
jgi:hypothetical protein